MRHRVLPLLAAVALLAGAAACDGVTEVQAGQPFQLKVGETAVLPDSSAAVRFAGVPQDSRCPSDVVCVWEGDATVRLDLLTPHDTSAVDLHTSPRNDWSRSAVVGNWSVELVEVAPHPRAGQPIAQGDYVVTLRAKAR